MAAAVPNELLIKITKTAISEAIIISDISFFASSYREGRFICLLFMRSLYFILFFLLIFNFFEFIFFVNYLNIG